MGRIGSWSKRTVALVATAALGVPLTALIFVAASSDDPIVVATANTSPDQPAGDDALVDESGSETASPQPEDRAPVEPSPEPSTTVALTPRPFGTATPAPSSTAVPPASATVVPSPTVADSPTVVVSPTPTPVSTPEESSTPVSTPTTPAGGGAHPLQGGTPCVLRLHGNNGSGGIDPAGQINGPYYADGDITLLDPISPTITSQNTWWEFDGPYGVHTGGATAYASIRGFLTDYVDSYDCGPILVWGLSGGAAMAAKLYCQGEDFGGRVWGFYFADPPMEESVLGCRPPGYGGMRTWLVQSDEFVTSATGYAQSSDGLCPVAEWGWYCENGRAVLPSDYYANLGLTPLSLVGSHLEALLAGTPTQFNMWDQLENWWHDYDPTRF